MNELRPFDELPDLIATTQLMSEEQNDEWSVAREVDKNYLSR